MKSKKSAKPTKLDNVWEEKVKKHLKTEGTELGHPKGHERFEKVIKKSLERKP